MVSDMESDQFSDDTSLSTQQQIDLAERASAAPFVDYPPTPGWYAPVIGLWAAGMTAVASNMSDNKAIMFPLLFTLIVLEFAFLSWYRRFMGTMPNLKNAPAEIKSEMHRYLAGVLVSAAAIVLAVIVIGWWAGSIVAFATVTIGLTVYERRYAAAATRAKQRLS